MIPRARSLAASDRWWWLAALLLLATVAIFIMRGPHWREHHGPVALIPGLTVEDAPAPEGLVVTSLRSGSEAATSGIEVGDGIERIDDQAVDDLDDAIAYLSKDRNPAIVLAVAHGERRRAVRLRRAGGNGHGA